MSESIPDTGLRVMVLDPSQFDERYMATWGPMGAPTHAGIGDSVEQALADLVRKMGAAMDKADP